MLKFIRTTSNNPDFQMLVRELEAELRLRDGENHEFYAELNKIDSINHVILAYDNFVAVGCGGVREYDSFTMEVKRMYVNLSRRGEGIATAVLMELEKWSVELAYKRCLLETGRNQPEAIALYLKNKYLNIPNFGKYKDSENSICFEKFL